MRDSSWYKTRGSPNRAGIVPFSLFIILAIGGFNNQTRREYLAAKQESSAGTSRDSFAGAGKIHVVQDAQSPSSLPLIRLIILRPTRSAETASREASSARLANLKLREDFELHVRLAAAMECVAALTGVATLRCVSDLNEVVGKFVKPKRKPRT